MRLGGPPNLMRRHLHLSLRQQTKSPAQSKGRPGGGKSACYAIKETAPRKPPPRAAAGLAIVRGDNPVDLFAGLQVVIGTDGILGVALGEGAKVYKRGVGDVR
jgi:hypothetical protein